LHKLIATAVVAAGLAAPLAAQPAIQHLTDFASRAPRGDPALEWARRRAAELQSALDAEKGDAR
jgi:hypothetical protein